MTTPTDQELDEKLIEAVAKVLGRAQCLSEQIFIDCWNHEHCEAEWKQQAQAVIPLITKREREKVLREMLDMAIGPEVTFVRVFAREKYPEITLP